ncbi:MAG: hypothetical protein HYY40_13920 [Bacteroidetes bacterium]|nr:hypothetical protein [Bacteroidota bacterium]
MKRTIIMTIIFSLLSAISTYFLFHSMEGFKTEVKESKIAVKEMQGQVSAIENKYKNEIQYWVQKNNSLQKQIVKTETALGESRQRINFMRKKIEGTIETPSALKVLPNGEDLGGACDSLKEQVTQFISEAAIGDSLCDNEIFDLKTVIQNKDSALTVCEKSFFAMNNVVNNSLAQQTALADKLNLVDKKLRRENRKTKFLSAAVFVLSGVTTTLLLVK